MELCKHKSEIRLPKEIARLCGVLPQGNPVGNVPSNSLPRVSTQCGKAAGTFHVPKLLVLDSGGPGGEGTSAPLRLVRYVHVSRAAHQALPDGMV